MATGLVRDPSHRVCPPLVAVASLLSGDSHGLPLQETSVCDISTTVEPGQAYQAPACREHSGTTPLANRSAAEHERALRGLADGAWRAPCTWPGRRCAPFAQFVAFCRHALEQFLCVRLPAAVAIGGVHTAGDMTRPLSFRPAGNVMGPCSCHIQDGHELHDLIGWVPEHMRLRNARAPCVRVRAVVVCPRLAESITVPAVA